MPDRIVRAGILTSDAVNKLSWAAETFYRRLMNVVDDYGRYDGRPAVLRATLYPLKLDRVSERDVETWLGQCQETGLVTCYVIEGKPYLVINKWRQQLRAMKSKFPAPDMPEAPKEDDLPEERDIEDALCGYLATHKRFCGHDVLSYARQVRVGSSYIDIVVDTEAGKCLVEIKRGNLTNKSLSQITRYLSAVPQSFGVLIGAEVGVQFNRDDCRESDVAVIKFSDSFDISIDIESSKVKSCEITLHQVKKSVTESYTETEVTTEEKIHTLTAFAEFWLAYPRKKSKGQAEKAWKKLNPDDPLRLQIMKGLERAKRSQQWKNDGGKFIPYPATWLNATGWEDEDASPVKSVFGGAI